jgi:alkylation response protein AidB-like acyl-CoA dehydrogenase
VNPAVRKLIIAGLPRAHAWRKIYDFLAKQGWQVLNVRREHGHRRYGYYHRQVVPLPLNRADIYLAHVSIRPSTAEGILMAVTKRGYVLAQMHDLLIEGMAAEFPDSTTDVCKPELYADDTVATVIFIWHGQVANYGDDDVIGF